jgi:hypothetical protein
MNTCSPFLLSDNLRTQLARGIIPRDQAAGAGEVVDPLGMYEVAAFVAPLRKGPAPTPAARP